MSKKHKISFQEQIEGFPIWQISIACVVRIVEPMAFTSLFPYIYFMVRDFHIAKTEADVSKYVGYLASCFSFCQFLSSVQWGMVADRIGRKKVLMIGLSGSTIGMLIIGFAQNYWMAAFARCLMGLVNGNTAVLRTLIGENCKEKKHQLLLLSTMPLLYQLGCILGPSIGGLLTNRSDNDTVGGKVLQVLGFDSFSAPTDYSVEDSIYYKTIAPIMSQSSFTDQSFHKFVKRFPYALSNVVLAFAFANSIICCFLFLEETHETIKYKRDYGLELGDKLRQLFGIETPVRPWAQKRLSSDSKVIAEDEELLLDSSSSSTVRYGSTLNTDDDDDDNENGHQNVNSTTVRVDSGLDIKYDWKVVFCNPDILKIVISQVVMSAHNTVYNEFLPVFLAKRTMREGNSSDLTSPLLSKFPFKIVGGMGLNSVNVGQILAGTGVTGIFIVSVVFPWIDRNFKPLRLFTVLSFVYCIVYFSLPYLVFTLPPNVPSMVYTRIALYALTFTRVMLSGTTVPLIVLLLHRAAPPRQRAYINGAALSTSALMRFLAPLIWGNIMSYADKVEKGWITWWTLLLCALLAFFQSFKLKDEEEEDDAEANDVDDATAVQIAAQEEEELEG